MDISEWLFAGSIASMAIAILKISNDKKNNPIKFNNYVKQDDCNNIMLTQANSYNQRINDLQTHLDKRIDDIISRIK